MMINYNKQVVYLKEGLSVDECIGKYRTLDCVQDLFNELDERGFIQKDRFVFVGIYMCRKEVTLGIIVVGYPKYFRLDDERQDKVLNHMNLVCRVIEQAMKEENKIFVKNYDFNSYFNQEKMREVELIKLADFILKDYIDYGIYKFKLKATKKNGKGRIQWQQTVNKCQAIVESDYIIYHSTINRITLQDFTQSITEIHKAIIHQCYKQVMEPLGEYKYIILPQLNVNLEEDLSKYTGVIIKYFSQVFSEREITLLKALATWCEASPYYQEKIVGVTNFDKIWEYATREFFGNIEHTKSEVPEYTIENRQYNGEGTAEPDILNVFHYKSQNCIAIFDAKYYYPKYFNKDQVKGLPANSDVVKQVDYYHAIKQRYDNITCQFTNAFLIPQFTYDFGINENMLQDKLYREVGTVKRSRPPKVDPILKKLEIKGESKQEKEKSDFVLVFEVNTEKLYKQVLQGEKIVDKRIYEDYINPFMKRLDEVLIVN